MEKVENEKLANKYKSVGMFFSEAKRQKNAEALDAKKKEVDR